PQVIKSALAAATRCSSRTSIVGDVVLGPDSGSGLDVLRSSPGRPLGTAFEEPSVARSVTNRKPWRPGIASDPRAEDAQCDLTLRSSDLCFPRARSVEEPAYG